MLKDHPRIRLALYLLALAGNAAAPFVAILYPDVAAATVTSAAVLSAAALATAATNVAPGTSSGT